MRQFYDVVSCAKLRQKESRKDVLKGACKFSSVKSSWGLDFLFAGYNKDTVKGTAASRVFFRLRAEAVRMREEWPDFVSPRANTPARESVSRLSRSQHSICAGSTASFWRVRVNLRRLNKR